MESIIALIDGSLEALLTVVYRHYYEKFTPADIHRADDSYQQRLDADYVYVDADPDKALRVLQGIEKRVSPAAADTVCTASLSGREDRYFTIYHYILLGFTLGRDVDNHLQNDYVRQALALARNVGGEAHHLKGFCRFAETETGVYYCNIAPDNNVLPLLSEHFVDRLGSQPWIIHDVRRQMAAVYDGRQCVFTEAPGEAVFRYTEDEEKYQKLFQAFHEAIAIESRKNLKLQTQMLPKKFRPFMTEFNVSSTKSNQPLFTNSD